MGQPYAKKIKYGSVHFLKFFVLLLWYIMRLINLLYYKKRIRVYSMRDVQLKCCTTRTLKKMSSLYLINTTIYIRL